jgi:imidazolonepropionase
MYIKNIHQLVGILPKETKRLNGKDMGKLEVMENAWIHVKDGLIEDFGLMSNYSNASSEPEFDASGKIVLPGFIDSHTHLVFAAYREQEFVDRIKGLSYAEIAAKGGGILNSARKMADATEEQLLEESLIRLNQCIKSGTCAIEIKSGYGLNPENELKMLRVIKKLKALSPIPVKATFLGAHAYPLEYKENHQGYLNLLKEACLPVIQKEQLAEYIDVFCEQGFFSIEESRDILKAGAEIGLKAKIHANQLHHSGGVELGVELGALSVDHLECMGEKEICAKRFGYHRYTLAWSCVFFRYALSACTSYD